jgi:hypothetical protein
MGMFCKSVNHHKNNIMSFLLLKQTHYEVHTNRLPLVIKDPPIVVKNLGFLSTQL